MPSVVFSQGWDDRDAFFGSGTLTYKRQTSKLVRAGIRRDGNLVNLRMRNESGEVHIIDCRFSRDVSGGYEADVSTLDGEEATGLMYVGTRGEMRTKRAVQLRRTREQLTMSFAPDQRTAGAAKPNVTELTLSDRGTGQLMIRGRKTQDVDRVSVSTRRDGGTEIVVSGPNALTMRFHANVVRSDASTLNLRLTASGMAETTGGGEINYARNRLDSVRLTGKLDGQTFALTFDRRDDSGAAGSDLNLSQQGSGLLEIAGRPRDRLAAAAVTVRRGAVEIRLTRRDGSVFALTGRESRRDAYTVRVTLSSSGQAEASGSATISYGANNRINSLSVDGYVDGQSTTVYFAP